MAVILADLGILLANDSISVLPTLTVFSDGSSKDLDFFISHQNVSENGNSETYTNMIDWEVDYTYKWIFLLCTTFTVCC